MNTTNGLKTLKSYAEIVAYRNAMADIGNIISEKIDVLDKNIKVIEKKLQISKEKK